MSTFNATGPKWKGYTVCRSCIEKHYWYLDPDKPIEWQAVRSTRPLIEPDDQQ